jgi:hypothetical protein
MRTNAYGVTMMGSLGEVVSRAPDLRSLDDSDFRILKSKGITEQDFKVEAGATGRLG